MTWFYLAMGDYNKIQLQNLSDFCDNIDIDENLDKQFPTQISKLFTLTLK